MDHGQSGGDTDQAGDLAVSSKRKRQAHDNGEVIVKRERGDEGPGKDGNQHSPSSDAAMWKMVCPITNAMFEEPVEAPDGCTYSKHALLAWVASCKERGVPITSPSTRMPMGEDLIPNLKLEAAVAEFREKRAAKRVENVQHSAGPVPSPQDAQLQVVAEGSETFKSLADLGGMFSLLDGMRGLLAETLNGWQPPQIVVVGQESSGKSSVLERLMMTPILPRDENICTRLPIHVRLRRSERALPPKLEVYNVATKQTERGPYVIAAQSGAADVSEEMHKIILEEHGALQGVSTNRIIILHITSPDVPFLDLIDMPGIVAAPSGNEPSDMATQTATVVKAHMQSEHGSNSLYLAVVKATHAPNTSNAMQILHEANLYPKTLGIFTFCDELGVKNAKRLRDWLSSSSGGQGSIPLEPYGWVATTNAPPEDEAGNVLVYKSDFERLQAQADGEIGVFQELGLGALVDQGLASHGVLVSRLNRMFLNHLKTTWVPGTLEKLNVEKEKYEFENARLGMPPAHERWLVPHVKGIIENAVVTDLGQGVPRLLREYSTFHRPLKVQIVDAVRNEIKNAFQKWSPRVSSEIYDSVIVGKERNPWVKDDHHDLIIKWLMYQAEHPAQSVEFKLLYRASQDGWEASDFHSRCDNQGATITFIKCTGGNVFGGYADASWTSSDTHVQCPKSFLFSLHRPGVKEVPIMVPQWDPEHAIYCSPTQGPSFGGETIVVQNKGNAVSDNVRTNFRDQGNGEVVSTESPLFQAQEVEVYQVVYVHCDAAVSVPLEHLDDALKCVPDFRGALVKFCNLQNVFKDTFPFEQKVRELFPAERRRPPSWPSPSATDFLKRPPLMLTERFPSVVDRLAADVRDIKPKADAAIEEAVTNLILRFNDEATRVDTWRKTVHDSTVSLVVVSCAQLLALSEELHVCLVRHRSAMLQELRGRVGQCVERSNLVESCGEKRRDVLSQLALVERARDGMFELMGMHTPVMRAAFERDLADVKLFRQVAGDSEIHARQQHHHFHILSWLRETRGDGRVVVKLLYRASRDGWEASDFHSRCDNQGATITFIKCTGGNVFGGYADASWTSSNTHVRCPKAFLFSLRRPGGEEVPIKLPVADAEHAMYCSTSFGPSFGKEDIWVQNNANATATNNINITSYTLPPDRSNHFLAGASFQVLEIEVYGVIVR